MERELFLMIGTVVGVTFINLRTRGGSCNVSMSFKNLQMKSRPGLDQGKKSWAVV